jgi:hypothetical protein
MGRRIGFPRNEASRRDKILSREIIFKPGRDIKTRNDILAGDVHSGNVAPTIALTGTAITSGLLEAEVVTGSETVIITLTNDTWAPTLGADNAITTAFLAAITGDDAGANGFDDEVALVHGNLVRTSDTVVTLTLPAAASYSPTADETITVAPPASSVVRGVAPASQTFVVSTIIISLSGTMVAGGVLESEMVAGGETLIITVTGDTWHADVGADNAITTALLAGITGDDDYATIAALTDFGDVVRTSANIVTITYPAAAGYAIATDETVTVAVPASAVALGVPPASDTVTITAE